MGRLKNGRNPQERKRLGESQRKGPGAWGLRNGLSTLKSSTWLERALERAYEPLII